MDGVPALQVQPAEPKPTPALKGDKTPTTAAATADDWGLYLGTDRVLAPDTILAMEYRRDWQLPDYPQENGAFQTYNKVAHPFMVRLTMSKGGKVADRSDFLAKVEEVAGSLLLYQAVTPEKVYLNMNVERFDYRRSASSGAGLITVEMWLIEIRDSTRTVFTKTKVAASADTVNGGNVQARAPTAAEASAARPNAVAGP